MNLIVFFGLLFSVLIFEFLFSQIKFKGNPYKQHHFYFSRYIFYLTFLVISSMFLVYQEGAPLLITILVFAVAGPLLEWSVGISYYKIVGQRLWTYHRGTVHGYTSYLAIPLWAFCGVVSWLLIKVII